MASKRLNRKLVIGLTLLTFLSMIALSLLMLLHLQKGDPDKLADIAKRHQEAGEWRQATYFYHRAYKKGGRVDHLVAAGEMLLKDGEVGLAIGAWRDALVQRPDMASAHHQLLDTLLELARIHDRIRSWTAVREAAEAFLEVGPSAEDQAFARHVEGLALVKLSSQSPQFADRGIAALEEATRLAPLIVDYAIDLARQRSAAGLTEESEHALRALLRVHSEESASAARVRTAFAQHLASQERLEEASSYHEEALRMAAGDDEALLDAKLAYSDFLIRRWARARIRDEEEATESFFKIAETQMRECIAIDQDSFDAYLQLAILYKAANRNSRVIDICDERLRQRPPRKGLKATENQLNTFRLLILASEACVTEAVGASKRDDLPARRDWLTKSRRYLDDADAEFPEHPKVLSQRGRILLAEGRDRQALEMLRKADETYRTYDVLDWDNKLRLARLHMSLNEPGAALAVLEEVIDKATGRRSVVFWKLYVQVLLRNSAALDTLDDPTVQKVEGALARLEMSDPHDADLPHLRAAVFERMGNPRQAAPLVESLTERALLEARSLAEDGETDRALEVVLQALTIEPTDARLVTTAVNELIRQDKVENAHSIVKRAVEIEPNNRLFLRLAVLTRDEMTTEQRDRALLDIIKSHDDAYQRAWDLIDYYWRRRDFTAALPYFEEAEKHLVEQDTPMARNATKGQHRALLKAKMFLAAQLEDEPAMAAARDSAARYGVDGAGGKSLLGLYHMYRNEMDQATIAFSSAIEEQPTDARLLSYLGHCYRSAGRVDDAWRTYARAVQMNPSEGTAHKGLAMIAKKRGEEESFREHLAICARLLPRDPWVRSELLAQRENEDPQRAIEEREQRLVQDPDDLANLARLADLSDKVGDLEGADRYYARLLELQPDKKDLIAAVAKYYRRTDRPEQALALVKGFADTRKNDELRAEAMILVAAHHLNQGRVDEVEATLVEAADLSATLSVCRGLADFYLRTVKRPTEALRWLEKAVALARDEKSPQLAHILGARIVCVLHREIYDLDTARHHVDEFVREFPDDPRGRLWDAEVHARSGQIDSAIEALTQYLTKRPGNAYALFQRAQYNGEMGRRAAAIADLESLKRTDPTALNLEPRVLLARLQALSGRLDEWVAELESIVADVPDSSSALEELMGAYIQTKRFAEADQLVTAQLNRAENEPDGKWYFLRGRVSLELGGTDDALRDFQEGAKLAGFSARALADVLSLYLRLGEFDDGAAYYESHASEKNEAPVTLSRYAHLLAKSGAEDRAVAAFREAVALSLASETSVVGAVTGEIVRAFAPPKEIADVAGLFENAAVTGLAARANDRILARLYAQLGRRDEAVAKLDHLLKSADSDREQTVLLMEKGDLFRVSGQARESVAVYEKALGLDPSNWVVLNNVAFVLSDELGDYDRALPYGKRAVAIADIAATLDTLGWIYVGLGEYAKAIAELSRSIRLDPTDPFAYYHLGEAYRRNGRFIEANDVLDRGRKAAGTSEFEAAVELIDEAKEKTGRQDAGF